MEREPTLLDYARFHGIAIPYTEVDPLQDFLASNPPHLDLGDPPGCQVISDLINPALCKNLTNEKIIVDRSVAGLIAHCLKPPKPPPWSTFDEYRHVQNLKVELPLLRSVPDVDVKQFKAEARRPVPDLNGLQPIPVDEENDEGLAWPRKFLEAGDQLNDTVRREKLDTTREALSTMRKLLEHPFDAEIERQAVKGDLHYHKAGAYEPLTPLLVPLEETKEPFVPSSPALRLDLLSDKSDPALLSPKQLQKEISDEDQITTEDCGGANVGKVEDLLELAKHRHKLPDWSAILSESSVDRTKQDVKLESILLPLSQDSPPPRPSPRTNLSRFVDEAVPISCSDDLQIDKLEELLNDENLGQVARLALENLNTKIAHEPIDHVDALGRVSIPELQPVKTQPPWKKNIASTYTLDTAQLKVDAKCHQQQLCNDLDRHLRWAPLSSKSAKVDLDESISGSKETASPLLSPPKATLRSKDILPKLETLRHLENDGKNDGEELKEDTALAAELSSLQATRLSRHPRGINSADARKDDKNLILLKRPAPPTFMANADDVNAVPSNAPATILCKAADPLSSFLQTRGHKFRKLEHATSSHFPRREIDSSQHRSCSQPEIQVPAMPEPAIHKTPITVSNTYSSPPKVSLSVPKVLIIDTALLKTYSSLVNRLEAHSPHPPNLIFRDLSSSQKTSSPNEAAAPDIILSPTVALIIVPLQSINQRTLPGQGPSTPPVQSRITSLALQFPKLFVLATCKTDPSREFNTAVSSSLIRLQSHCASLGPNSEASTILIPPMTADQESPNPPILLQGHTPKLNHHLLNWILALVERHGFPPSPLKVINTEAFSIEEETIWELFLRKAGLNPYAAMVVIGMLGKPSSGYDRFAINKRKKRTTATEAEVWGLRRLVQMSQEERENAFAGVIGSKVVKALGEMLDFLWADAGLGHEHGAALDEIEDGKAEGAIAELISKHI